MRAEIAAIQTALTPVIASHWLRVEGALTRSSYPYALLWQSTGHPFAESSLCGDNAAIDALLGVTVAGLTVEQAETKARAVRATLSPSGRALSLDVPGRVAEIRWQAFSVMREDRDAPLVDLGMPGHVVVHVDLYRLISYPT